MKTIRIHTGLFRPWIGKLTLTRAVARKEKGLIRSEDPILNWFQRINFWFQYWARKKANGLVIVYIAEVFKRNQTLSRNRSIKPFLKIKGNNSNWLKLFRKNLNSNIWHRKGPKTASRISLKMWFGISLIRPTTKKPFSNIKQRKSKKTIKNTKI
jgi:hypothetical protein